MILAMGIGIDCDPGDPICRLPRGAPLPFIRSPPPDAHRQPVGGRIDGGLPGRRRDSDPAAQEIRPFRLGWAPGKPLIWLSTKDGCDRPARHHRSDHLMGRDRPDRNACRIPGHHGRHERRGGTPNRPEDDDNRCVRCSTVLRRGRPGAASGHGDRSRRFPDRRKRGVLFLFALTMIFGEPKAAAEERDLETSDVDRSIYPLAIPSIASPRSDAGRRLAHGQQQVQHCRAGRDRTSDRS